LFTNNTQQSSDDDGDEEQNTLLKEATKGTCTRTKKGMWNRKTKGRVRERRMVERKSHIKFQTKNHFNGTNQKRQLS
jgi:hypothetical protein